MSSDQKEAGIGEEFVGPLLKLLKLAKKLVPENSEMEKFIDQISTEVQKTKDILDRREKLDRELIGYLGKIEKQIDHWIDQNPHEKAYDLPQITTIIEQGEPSNRIYQMDKNSTFQKIVESLDPLQRRCLESLSIFPENTELKTILVIYCWVTLFGKDTNSHESLFSNLVDKQVLIPVYREHNKVMDRFTIEPTFHKWLISNERYGYGHTSYVKSEEGTWCLYPEYQNQQIKMLLNLDQRYLNSKDIMGICSEHDELRVIQFGSWRYTLTEVHNNVEKTESEEIKSKDHIEVDKTDFLKKVGNVRYLSLCGISGITELPESIGKLKFLEILDLRACHNLEKLPQKTRSGRWFHWLNVLDISECYLLNHMPKWVCDLSTLTVLKGFVVGNLGNKNQSCQLHDLSKLNKLKKLSIRFATGGILSPEVFRGFNSLDSLLVLIITWGDNKYKEIPTYSLPKNLQKLDIRCCPEEVASKLQNTGELKYLKRLYIRGGYLTKIPSHDNWKVEILRLRFLKKLIHPDEWNEVRSKFKNLKYVEYVGCPKPKNFPNMDGSSWHNEELTTSSVHPSVNPSVPTSVPPSVPPSVPASVPASVPPSVPVLVPRRC